MKDLHGLAAAIVYAMEPRLPLSEPWLFVVRAWCRPSNLRLRALAVIFVDAVLDIFGYRSGAFIPKMNTLRSSVILTVRHNQQSAGLWGVCWVVCLARRFGWRYLFLLTNSQVP